VPARVVKKDYAQRDSLNDNLNPLQAALREKIRSDSQAPKRNVPVVPKRSSITKVSTHSSGIVCACQGATDQELESLTH